MTKIKTEVRQMRAGPTLLIQMIKRQAGTIAKAVLEGTMNSSDAKAKFLNITLTSSQLSLVDNGHGFQTDDEIKKVFEVLGFEHNLDEDGINKDGEFKTFGIGRGQLFAFGKNTWRSGEFRMVVDIESWVDDHNYEFSSGHRSLPGCAITVDLYDHLSPRDIQVAVDEITKYCRYLPMTVELNGEKINVDPASAKWHIDHDLAYINKRVNKSHWRTDVGLDVYMMGAYVETIPLEVFSLEGVVVIKESVKLNFARNQVLRSCKRWKKIAALLLDTGIEESKKKKSLTASEARGFLTNYAAGAGISYAEFMKVSCLPDTNGKLWSVFQLQRLCNSRTGRARILKGPVGEIRIGFAEAGSRVGDKVMQLRKALVLNETVIERANCKTREEFLNLLTGEFQPANVENAVFRTPKFRGKLALCEPKELLETQNLEHTLVPQGAWTKREAAVINALYGCQWSLEDRLGSRQRKNHRQFAIGESATASGWTDGSTYIALNRQFIKDLNLGLERDWHSLMHLVIHEYCHGHSDEGTHTHSPEFYERFHNTVMEIGHHMGRNCYQTYRQKLYHKTKKLTKPMTNQLHSEAEAFVQEQYAYNQEEPADATA